MGCGASSGPPIFALIEQGEAGKVRNTIRNDPVGCCSGTNSNGDTALHHAAWKEPGETATCLKAVLEAPGLNLNALNKTGWTALHLAAAHGKEESMRELLKSGAKADVGEPCSGNTPLHLAVVQEKPGCLQAAVDCGINLALKNGAGKTPLHLAAQQGSGKCAEVLLSGKLKVNDESGGSTALHEAAAAGHREMAEMLMKAGADLQAKDSGGKLPRDLAYAAGHKRLAEILGATPKEQDVVAGRVTATLGGGHVIEGDPEGLIAANEETRRRVQELMDKTWKDTRTRDRTSAKVATFEVVHVQQNVSKMLWEHYVDRRKALQLHYVQELTDVKTLVPAFEEGLVDPRVQNANEFFLFHGSRPQALTSICEGGFRVDLSGSNRGSLYGPGVYCAESSAKADEYAEDDKDGLYKGLYAMLLCRVSLGNPIVNEEVEPNLEELDRLLSTDDKHSIVGDRERARGTYREFVIRDPQQVYPAYAIIYRRKEV